MTEQEWKKVKEAWEGQFSISLKVDDYELYLYMTSYKMRLRREVYVNGTLNLDWLDKGNREDYPPEGIRFYKTTHKQVYSAKYIKEWQKDFGKRSADKLRKARYEYKLPYWTSFNAFKRHILKHNKEIELIDC